MMAIQEAFLSTTLSPDLGNGWSKPSQKDFAIWSVGAPATLRTRGRHRGLGRTRPWIKKQLSETRWGEGRKPSTACLADESWQSKAVPGNNRLKWELIKHRIYIAHLHLLHVKRPHIQKIMTDAKQVLNTAGLSVGNGWGASSPD